MKYPDIPTGLRLARTKIRQTGGVWFIGLRPKSKGRTCIFVNACPHQFLPFDQRTNSILSSDGLRLICSNHFAEFDIETGKGSGEFGTGCQLVEVPAHASTDGLFIRQ